MICKFICEFKTQGRNITLAPNYKFCDHLNGCNTNRCGDSANRNRVLKSDTCIHLWIKNTRQEYYNGCNANRCGDSDPSRKKLAKGYKIYLEKIWRLSSSFYRYFQFLLLQQYGNKNNGCIFLKSNNLSFPNSFNIYRSKSVEGVFYKFDIVSLSKYGHNWNVQINPEWSEEMDYFGTS